MGIQKCPHGGGRKTELQNECFQSGIWAQSGFLLKNLHVSFKDSILIYTLQNQYSNKNISYACMFSVCVIHCVCKKGTADVCVCLLKEGAK